MNIVTWPHPVLATVCEPVGAIDAGLRTLVACMLKTMYAAEGRGLAAPQVGETLRIFVMDVAWKEAEPDPFICINPEIIEASDEKLTREEGCLSIPGIAARVKRPAMIRMQWMDIDGILHKAQLDGAAATCAQHEIDHLDGIVTLDRLDRQTRQALIEGYEA